MNDVLSVRLLQNNTGEDRTNGSHLHRESHRPLLSRNLAKMIPPSQNRLWRALLCSERHENGFLLPFLSAYIFLQRGIFNGNQLNTVFGWIKSKIEDFKKSIPATIISRSPDIRHSRNNLRCSIHNFRFNSPHSCSR